jgi:hypothetical protein
MDLLTSLSNGNVTQGRYVMFSIVVTGESVHDLAWRTLELQFP